MSPLEQIGEAMLLAQEGQRQIAREAAAALARLAVQCRSLMCHIISKVPPAEA